MADSITYTVKSQHPTVELWYDPPFYIVPLDTNAGPISLIFQEQALVRLQDEIQNRTKHARR